MRASSAACRRSLKKEPLTICKTRSLVPHFSASLRNYRVVAHFRSAVSFRGSTDKLKARVAAGFFFFSVILHNYLRGFLMFACAAACLAKQLRQPVIPQLLARILDVCLRCRFGKRSSASKSYVVLPLLSGVLDIRLRCRFGKRSSASKSYAVHPYFLGFLIFACAAASLAIGTRKGEQDT